MATVAPPGVSQARLAYGTTVAEVEAGGFEAVAPAERPGRPRQLLWTSASVQQPAA